MHYKLANIIKSRNFEESFFAILSNNISTKSPENKIFLYSKQEKVNTNVFKAILIDSDYNDYMKDINDITVPLIYIDKSIDFIENNIIVKIDNKNSAFIQVSDLSKGSIDLYLTGKCNQKCFACPSPESSRNDTVPKDEVLRIAELLDGVNTHINVTGGEPTYYNDYFIDVIKMLQKKAPKSSVQVLTTAISFANNCFIEKIIKNEIKMDKILFSVALYGSKNSIQDLAVGVTNSLPILNKALINMIELNAIVELRVVITQYNFTDLQNISDYIITKYKGNILRVVFMGLEMSGNARKNQEKVWIDFEKHNPYLENAILNLMSNGIQVRLYNYPLCYLKKNYWTLSKDSISYWKKKFLKDCDSCRVKEYCSGFFAATIPFIKKVYPVQGDK